MIVGCAPRPRFSPGGLGSGVLLLLRARARALRVRHVLCIVSRQSSGGLVLLGPPAPACIKHRIFLLRSLLLFSVLFWFLKIPLQQRMEHRKSHFPYQPLLSFHGVSLLPTRLLGIILSWPERRASWWVPVRGGCCGAAQRDPWSRLDAGGAATTAALPRCASTLPPPHRRRRSHFPRPHQARVVAARALQRALPRVARRRPTIKDIDSRSGEGE